MIQRPVYFRNQIKNNLTC